jgi:hypothetical protein
MYSLDISMLYITYIASSILFAGNQAHPARVGNCTDPTNFLSHLPLLPMKITSQPLFTVTPAPLYIPTGYPGGQCNVTLSSDDKHEKTS